MEREVTLRWGFLWLILCVQGFSLSAMAKDVKPPADPNRVLGQLRLMMNIQQFRRRYPQYADLNDTDLARRVHDKLYPDVPFELFAFHFGVTVSPVPEAGTVGDSEGADDSTVKTTGRRVMAQTLQDERLAGSALAGLTSIHVVVSGPICDEPHPGILPSNSQLQTKAELALRRNGIAVAEEPALPVLRIVVAITVLELPELPLYAFTISYTLCDAVIVVRSEDSGPAVLASVWPNPLTFYAGPGYASDIHVSDCITDTMADGLERFCNDYLAANPPRSHVGDAADELDGTEQKSVRHRKLEREVELLQELLRRQTTDKASPAEPNVPAGFVLDPPPTITREQAIAELRRRGVLPEPNGPPTQPERTAPEARGTQAPEPNEPSTPQTRGVFERSPASLRTFLEEWRIGSSPDFAIEQQSKFEPARWDHVITVHGFVSDFVVAQQLVRYLSESGNDRYRTVQLNK